MNGTIFTKSNKNILNNYNNNKKERGIQIYDSSRLTAIIGVGPLLFARTARLFSALHLSTTHTSI
jgi:hypothetical protein